jgi:chromosome partitioning protein
MGGIGKTTTALNIAILLAEKSKTLLVDMDNTANATDRIGINLNDLKFSIYNLLCKGASAATVILPTMFNNLDVLPSDIKFAFAENELRSTPNKGRLRLKETLSGIQEKYAYTIIDCPPCFNIATQNALMASTGIIIPMEPGPNALAGISILDRQFACLKNEMKQEVNVLGILIARVNPAQTQHQKMIKKIKKHFGHKVFKTLIKKDLSVSEKIHAGNPFLFDPKSAQCRNYRELFEREFLPLLNKNMPKLY